MKTLINRSLLISVLIAFCLIAFQLSASAASLGSSSGRVNSSDGAFIRSSCSTSAKVVATVADNTKLTITKEIFTSKSKTNKSTRWYRVKAGGKTGYIRSDLVDNIKYASYAGTVTDGLNCRVGPGTSMKITGSVAKGSKVTVHMTASLRGSSDNWYRITSQGKTYYVSAKYVKLGKATSSKTPGNSETKPSTSYTGPKSALAKALLANPTAEGTACRIVATLDTSNCSKKFKVSGYGSAKTPQGMCFTGDLYTIVWGNSSSQAIVTYDQKGNRVRAVKFPYNMGHPNGITYNPNTDKYYIFKGNQFKIYTFDPSSGGFGTATTPYQSSGVGYDRIKNTIVASSRTGMRVYSSDGKFTHKQLVYRATHSGTHYVQDCCAYNGIVLHGVSGSNKATKNYIDVYRLKDSKYLGSLKLTIGEIESMSVNNDGYLELLINTASSDYIWKTSFNVNEIC